jgi:hypothetical protein
MGSNLLFARSSECNKKLAAEMGEEPEEQRKPKAEEEAGDDREIESGVLAAVEDIAGNAAKTQRKSSTEVEKCADEDEEPSQNEEGAAKITERIHRTSLEQGTWEVKSSKQPKRVQQCCALAGDPEFNAS